MEDDHTLLCRFAKSKDERAFTELVRRHLDMVYGVCLRRTGNRQLAEELVQNVFATLARKAGSLKPEVLVLGWLHRTAHFESLSAFRSEVSRLRTMKNYTDFQSQTDAEPNRYREISPFLDEALHALPPSDRDVVLLRFASDLTLQQIGHRLGKSESAAQRHLQRVLEKLAVILRRRGVTISATALALMLGVDFAKAAPASLTVTFVSKTAIASGAAASGMTLMKITTLLYIMKNKAIIVAAVCLLTAGGSAIYLTAQPSSAVVASSLSSTKLAGNSASGSVTSTSKDLVAGMSEEIIVNSTSRRPRPASAYQELDAKFGAPQVRLAKSATDNWVKFEVEMETMRVFLATTNDKLDLLENEEHEGAVSAKRRKDEADDPLSSIPGLTLTADQKAKVEALQLDRKATEQDAIKAVHTRFTKNRTDVMELLLASDAANHGKMSVAEYQAVLDGKKELLLAMDGLKPKEDTILNQFYRSELPSILDQDQMAVFEKFCTEQAVTLEERPVNKTLGILGIKRASDGPKADARTLEQIDADLRKMALGTGGALKLMEAAAVLQKASGLFPETSK